MMHFFHNKEKGELKRIGKNYVETKTLTTMWIIHTLHVTKRLLFFTFYNNFFFYCFSQLYLTLCWDLGKSSFSFSSIAT